jgi:hypothetical protein
MKQIICISAIIFSLFACQKETIEESNTTPSNGSSSTGTMPPVTTVTLPQDATLILQGNFTSSNSYTTTGSAKVYEDKSKKRTLVFENFKTNNGPDLKIYIAEDNAVTNFVQITDKVNTNGSYSLPIPDNVDFKKQNTVVIWCKSFSRSFGSAILK